MSPMPRKPLEATRYGRLTVLGATRDGWLCLCDCGTEVVVTGTHLRQGRVVSCGCYNRDRIAAPRTHGMSNSRAYIAWRSMHQRCRDPNRDSYPLYGARGIRVCERWAQFENFLADMGEPPKGTSLDRKDSEGHYEPKNCRWATAKEQSRNRRWAKLITVRGQTRPLAEWCELTGVGYHSAYNRLAAGSSPEEVFGL